MTLAEKLQRHRNLFQQQEPLISPISQPPLENPLEMPSPVATVPPWEEPTAPSPTWNSLEAVTAVVYPSLPEEAVDPLPVYSLQQNLAFARRQQPQPMGEDVG